MTNSELQKWLTSILTEGIEVNLLFPNSYNSQHSGYGYQVSISNGRQRYYVSLRRDILEPRFFIHSIWKVCLDKTKDEKIHLELEGQEVLLEPKEPRTFGPDESRIAITGILRLR